MNYAELFIISFLIVYIEIFTDIMVNKISFIMLFGIMLMLFGAFSNATITGVENITLSRYSANVLPGGNVTVNYSLKLISGYYSFSTDLYVVNSVKLSSHNVSVILSNKFGNPTINGTMYIFLDHSVNQTTWNITLNGNSTGVAVNHAVFTLNLKSNSTTSTSVSTVTSSSATTTQQSTIATTIVSTATSTIFTGNPGGAIKYNQSNSSYVFIILALVIIIAILLVLFITKNKGSGKRNK